VSGFMKGLGLIAEHYHIAIVCSVGSRKLMQKEQFAAKRDSLFGSTAWARTAETVIIVEGSDPNIERKIFVMSRNGRPEMFHMEFRQGRFVECEQQADEPVDLPAVAFAKERPGYFTSREYQEAKGLSKWVANRHIQDAKDAGLLRQKPGKTKGYAPEYSLAKGRGGACTAVSDCTT